MRSLLVNGASELIGVTLIAATILVCYRYADRMLRALGATGTSVLVRLSAFILLCIGVQIFWNGASALVGIVAEDALTRRRRARPAAAASSGRPAARSGIISRSIRPPNGLSPRRHGSTGCCSSAGRATDS